MGKATRAILIWSAAMLLWYIGSFIWASTGVPGCDVMDASGHCSAVIGLGTTVPYSFIGIVWLIGMAPLAVAWFAGRQESDAEAWQAGMAAAMALAGLWLGGYAFPGLHALPLLVAGPVIIAGLWLYRSEIRAAGWWSVGVAALIALGAGLFLVSPTYIGRMLP